MSLKRKQALARKQALPRWLLACISLLYHIVLDHGCTPSIVHHIHHVHLPSVPENICAVSIK